MLDHFFGRFYPDLVIHDVTCLPVAQLKRLGIRLLFFDIDNTLSPFDQALPSPAIIRQFQTLQQEGFLLCLLSNNTPERVDRFNGPLGVLAVSRAGKPGCKKLQAVLKDQGLNARQAALVGDQVFTDMYCAHSAGMLAIYSQPLCPRDQWITKIKRPAERIVLSCYERSRS